MFTTGLEKMDAACRQNSEMADVTLVLFSLSHLLAVKADYEIQSSSNALRVNSRFHGWSFFCLPSPHALNSALNTYNYIFIYIYTVYIKMKTRLDRITYNLRQSVKSLTSWHWLLVKAEASQECGMPPQQMRSLSWAGAPSRERMLNTSWVWRWRENQSWNDGLSHLVAEKTHKIIRETIE